MAERIAKRVAGRRYERGFSLAELLVSLLILGVLVAISLPTLMRSYRSYQLGDAATRLSGALKSTRFSAIRKNTPIPCVIQQSGSNWIVWTDFDKDGAPGPAEPQVVIGGSVYMLGSGAVPPPDSIVAGLGAGTPSLNVLSPGNSSLTFDSRGARQFSGPISVGVFYLGNPNIANLGFRAVVLLPSGNVQVWSTGPGGPWLRVN